MKKEAPELSVIDNGSTLVVDPGNEIVHIDEVWAFLSFEKGDDTEGIMSIGTAHGNMPLLAADAARLLSLMPYVEKIVDLTGRPARLVKFTKREEVKLIEPKAKQGE